MAQGKETREYRNTIRNAIDHAETLMAHLTVLKDRACEDDVEAEFVATEAQNECSTVIEYLDSLKGEIKA